MRNLLAITKEICYNITVHYVYKFYIQSDTRRIIKNYYLLFNNKVPSIISGDSHDVFTERDLCLERIKAALTELVVDYPVEFLSFILENKELAEYRLSIFEELINGECLEEIADILADIELLINEREITDSFTYRNQRIISQVYLSHKFLRLIIRIIAFLKEFNSEGLKRVGEMFVAYFSDDMQKRFEKLCRITEVLDEKLSIGIEVNFKKLTLAISETAVETDKEIQTLDDICKNIFGKSLSTHFSIADNISIMKPEMITLEYILYDNNGFMSDIESVIDTDLNWELLENFQKQIKFYYGYLLLIQKLNERSIDFCIPVFGENRIHAEALCDMTLAVSSINTNEIVTPNNISLQYGQNGAVITGANQGGKTVFLRSIGSACYLAMCGCPVPAKYFQLQLLDNIYTFFVNEEDNSL